MDHPFIVIAALCALSLVYVLAPVAAEAFARYRKARNVICPEHAAAAEIGIDARHAAWSAVAGKKRLRVRQCSLWPEKYGCAQHCVRAVASV